MTIVCDVDGVLASFESKWNPLLAKLAGEDKVKPTAGWVPDIWDWDVRAYGKEIVNQAWAEVGRSSEFWRGLHPMPGAQEACLKLSALQKSHDVFFLTSRSGIGVQRQTCEWLYKLGMLYPNVIVVKRWQDKIPLLQDLGASFFVDDKLETMQAWVTHTHLNRLQYGYWALIDAPYNREGRTVKGMRVAANLTEALKESGLV